MRPVIKTYHLDLRRGRQGVVMPRGAHIFAVNTAAGYSSEPELMAILTGSAELVAMVDEDAELSQRTFYLFRSWDAVPEEAQGLEQGSYVGTVVGYHIFDTERSWEPKNPRWEASLVEMVGRLREAVNLGPKTE